MCFGMRSTRLSRLRPYRTPQPMIPAPPDDAETDDPGADDGDVGLARIKSDAVRQPAAPFAGMTQTGSMGLISAALPRHPKPFTT